jgi:hypothetical protein
LPFPNDAGNPGRFDSGARSSPCDLGASPPHIVALSRTFFPNQGVSASCLYGIIFYHGEYTAKLALSSQTSWVLPKRVKRPSAGIMPYLFDFEPEFRSRGDLARNRPAPGDGAESEGSAEFFSSAAGRAVQARSGRADAITCAAPGYRPVPKRRRGPRVPSSTYLCRLDGLCFLAMGAVAPGACIKG